MLGTEFDADRAVFLERTPPPTLLAEEEAFYGGYTWCLNPHLTARSAAEHLRQEIGSLAATKGGWQATEVATNVFLLACALLSVLEEAIRGPALRIPRQIASSGIARTVGRLVEQVLRIGPGKPSTAAIRWKERLEDGLQQFLSVSVCGEAADLAGVVEASAGLTAALQTPLPPEVAARHIGVPSAFRRLDLTLEDSIALGRRFIAQCPDRSQPILLLGLRTSGSYLAPLLQAFLRTTGYATVSQATIQPGKGPGRQERKALERCARAGFMALILDDSPHSGGTILRALGFARHAGFPHERLRVLLPVHPANANGLGPLNETFAILLAPEEWRKCRLLDAGPVEARLAEYYMARGYSRVRVVPSCRADELNDELRSRSFGFRGSRLKRVHQVELATEHGNTELRLVLVKSVGVGWLGYHAFLAGHRLVGRVPPVLGLRDGMLYSEWVMQPAVGQDAGDHRAALIEASATYVAERVRRLALAPIGAARTSPGRHENSGLKLLARSFSKAYGSPVSDLLARRGIEQALVRLPCPFPTLIDGPMDRREWIAGPQGFLKTDFEHHGMGKSEVNVVDPAYDLANTVLTLDLSPDEEARLIARYTQSSGDARVGERLFISKILAGLWAMQSAQEYLLGKAQCADLQNAHHDHFLAAWHFLTVHAARFCGRQCRPAPAPAWSGPLVVLDVDGVIDLRTFGFPCTTAAGIEALSLLGERGFTVALNTARCAVEMRAYCEAYRLAGGIAEHGSYLWDAVARRERVLIDMETLRQLDELRAYLGGLPGVFLDHRHRYSIRAFTYVPRPAGLRAFLLSQSSASFSPGIAALSPLPTLVIEHCMDKLKLDRLAFHNTTIDTTIVARSSDKGTGLAALRDWTLSPDAETIAVGDFAMDLPMFREASRSFAPAQIDCAREARLLGCRIATKAHQRGLLEIVRILVDPDRLRSGGRADPAVGSLSGEGLFLGMLQAADRPRTAHLARRLFSSAPFKTLIA